MPIKNYTTKLSIDTIVGSIMGLLGSKGARQITTRYDDKGTPDAISFIFMVDSVPVPFRLPCNVEGVQKAIAREDTRWRAPRTREHAQAVAWAIVRDWVAAQMALIEADQASLAQVFLPYCILKGKGMQEGLTMFDKFMEQVVNTKQLPSSI